jgi:hypothetical protein
LFILKNSVSYRKGAKSAKGRKENQQLNPVFHYKPQSPKGWIARSRESFISFAIFAPLRLCAFAVKFYQNVSSSTSRSL